LRCLLSLWMYPNLCQRMRVYFNIFLISIFSHIHNITALGQTGQTGLSDWSDWSVQRQPEPEHPASDQIIRHVPEANRQMGRIIRPRVGSFDPVHDHLQNSVISNVLSWWISWCDLNRFMRSITTKHLKQHYLKQHIYSRSKSVLQYYENITKLYSWWCMFQGR
jgi:hypothetical protein